MCWRKQGGSRKDTLNVMSTQKVTSKTKSSTPSIEKSTNDSTVTGLLIGKIHNYGIRMRVLSDNVLELVSVHRMVWNKNKRQWKPIPVDVVTAV